MAFNDEHKWTSKPFDIYKLNIEITIILEHDLPIIRTWNIRFKVP